MSLDCTIIVLQSGGDAPANAWLLMGGIFVGLLVLFFGLGSSSSSSLSSIREDDLSNLKEWGSGNSLVPEKEIKSLAAAIESPETPLRRIVREDSIVYENPETNKRVAQLDIDKNFRVDVKIRISEDRMDTIATEVNSATQKDKLHNVCKLIQKRMDIAPEKLEENAVA